MSGADTKCCRCGLRIAREDAEECFECLNDLCVDCFDGFGRCESCDDKTAPGPACLVCCRSVNKCKCKVEVW